MANHHRRSQLLFEKALHLMPGGVSSPVRAFRAVGGTPFVVSAAAGAHLTDVDANTYLDFVGSWGPLLLGHGPTPAQMAIQEALYRGNTYGCLCEQEIYFAELISSLMPSIEQVRFVNSGTEATMSAIRLARAATHRDRLIKFDGCYHGHADSLLVKAGSGLATLGLASSAGVPEAVAQHTLSLPYNDLHAVHQAFQRFPDQIAAIIVEPIAGNMGCVPPAPGFLQGLRDACDQHQALLIFDEVMTGFRVALGGAQALYQIQPDLTTLAKIIGGGLPMGAYGGRRDLMQRVAPAGPVYQAGTLAGNPLAVAAGLATLQHLQANADTIYPTLEQRSARLEQALLHAAQRHGQPLTVNRVGAMLTPFFGPNPVTDLHSATLNGTDQDYADFFTRMLHRGFFFAPSRFECAFISTAHTEGHIQETANALDQVFAERAALT